MSTPRVSELGAARDGSTIVEFALVAPVFLVLVLGAFELCLILFTSGSLQSAVTAASRYGVTGQSAGGDRLGEITRILRARTFGLIDVAAADIETLVYPTFTGIGQPEPFTDANGNGVRDPGEPFVDANGNGVWDADIGAAGLGGPGDIVLYRVTYRSRLVNSFVSPLLGDLNYTASIAVRNEPF